MCFALLIPSTLLAARTCYSPDEALSHLNKDICVSAHVYDVVELDDGTRFLDLCSPETPDEQCHFTVVSRKADRMSVGDLEPYRQKDIQIRGVVRGFEGSGGITLSHVRQFHGGTEKFVPNPALLHGFSAESGRTAFSDPALRSGHHRSVFKMSH
jgi:hypothetical protein